MIQLMFECPTTGKPLYGMAIENWTGAAPDALIAMHCPKCSGMHEFARADGILAMGEQVGDLILAILLVLREGLVGLGLQMTEGLFRVAAEGIIARFPGAQIVGIE